MVNAMDILSGDGRDDRISEIFYFFEKLTTLESGRTIGRKIGVVQETLIRKYLEQDEAIRRRMYLEQGLEGASGAAHKVEFSFHPLKTHAGLNRGDEIPGTDGVVLAEVSPEVETLRLVVSGGKPELAGIGRPLPGRGMVRAHINDRKIDIRIIEIGTDGVTVDVVDRSRLLASIESKRVGAQRFSGSSKLGAGIQTIEKAKQASLVAIDLDLKHNGSIKPLQDSNGSKQLISIVALGNGVHWTPKDKAVLGTYVDFTWLVRDEAIIRYAEFVRDLAGEDVDFISFFSDYFVGMTKQKPDDFEVVHSDFSIITPAGEQRNFLDILHAHIVDAD